MTLIADVFSKLRSRKTVVREISKKSQLWTPFEKQPGKQAQNWSIWRQLNRKKTLLVIWKMFGLFLNIFTPSHKFSLLNRDKSTQAIQMQLSKNKKLFLIFYFILKMCLKFWTLWTKHDPHSWCISEITDSKKRC